MKQDTWGTHLRASVVIGHKDAHMWHTHTHIAAAQLQTPCCAIGFQLHTHTHTNTHAITLYFFNETPAVAVAAG